MEFSIVRRRNTCTYYIVLHQRPGSSESNGRSGQNNLETVHICARDKCSKCLAMRLKGSTYKSWCCKTSERGNTLQSSGPTLLTLQTIDGVCSFQVMSLGILMLRPKLALLSLLSSSCLLLVVYLLNVSWPLLLLQSCFISYQSQRCICLSDCCLVCRPVKKLSDRAFDWPNFIDVTKLATISIHQEASKLQTTRNSKWLISSKGSCWHFCHCQSSISCDMLADESVAETGARFSSHLRMSKGQHPVSCSKSTQSKPAHAKICRLSLFLQPWHVSFSDSKGDGRRPGLLCSFWGRWDLWPQRGDSLVR